MELSDTDGHISFDIKNSSSEIRVKKEFITSNESIKDMTEDEKRKYFELVINKAIQLSKDGDTTSSDILLERLKQIFDVFHFENDEYLEKLASLHHNQGTIKWQKGKLDDALVLLNQSLHTYQKLNLPARIASTTNNIGLVLYNKGDYNEALKYLTKSLEILKQEQDHTAIIQTKNNLAMIFEQNGDFKRAATYYQRCLTFATKHEMPFFKAVALTNSANLQVYFGHPQMAEHNYLKAKSIFEDSNVLYLANVYDGLGRISQLKGDDEQALKYYNKALDLKKTTNIEHELAITLLQLFEITIRNNKKQSDQYLKKIKHISNNSSNPVVLKYYLLAKSISQIMSSRASVKYLALNTLRQLTDDVKIPIDMRLSAANYLAELLFYEFSCAKDEEILTEIENLQLFFRSLDPNSQISQVNILKLTIKMFLSISKMNRVESDQIFDSLMDEINSTGYYSYHSFISKFGEHIERIKLVRTNDFPLQLNQILHSQPRLNIMTYLIFNPNTSFSILRRRTGYSSGKLINHCNLLEEEGYIVRNTKMSESGSISVYNITNFGHSELQQYAHQLSRLTSFFA